MKTKLYKLIFSVAALAVLLWPAPRSLAASPSVSEPVRVEDTLFLGEAVTLRPGGMELTSLLRREFGEEEGELEAWWVSPEGPQPLEQLGKERPKVQTDYRISVVLHGPEGKDNWSNILYRVKVVSGTVRVVAEGQGISVGDAAVFRLEGQGLTLYRQAAAEADPQGGPLVLEAQFVGLPYGVYQVTAVDGALEPSQTVCRVGVWTTDDTVDIARRRAVARFFLTQTKSEAIKSSFLLKVQP